jgi:hypothetical protein
MDGVRVILAGKVEAPGGLCPPHAGKDKNRVAATPAETTEPKRNLPMHPLFASRLDPMGAPFKWNGKLVV